MDVDADGLLDDLKTDGRELSDDGTEIDMPEIVDSDSSDDEDPEIRGGRGDWTRRKSNGLPLERLLSPT